MEAWLRQPKQSQLQPSVCILPMIPCWLLCRQQQISRAGDLVASRISLHHFWHLLLTQVISSASAWVWEDPGSVGADLCLSATRTEQQFHPER